MGAEHSRFEGLGNLYTGFRWGNLRERDHLENLSVDGRIKLKWIFKYRMEAWI